MQEIRRIADMSQECQTPAQSSATSLPEGKGYEGQRVKQKLKEKTRGFKEPMAESVLHVNVHHDQNPEQTAGSRDFFQRGVRWAAAPNADKYVESHSPGKKGENSFANVCMTDSIQKVTEACQDHQVPPPAEIAETNHTKYSVNQ